MKGFYQGEGGRGVQLPYHFKPWSYCANYWFHKKKKETKKRQFLGHKLLCSIQFEQITIYIVSSTKVQNYCSEKRNLGLNFKKRFPVNIEHH